MILRTDGVGEYGGDLTWRRRGGWGSAPWIKAVVRRCGQWVLIDEAATKIRGDAIRLCRSWGVEHRRWESRQG